MSSFNKSILMGRLTKDPELRSTTTGKNVCSFSLAVDKMGNTDQANFFDCVAWEKRAETISKYLNKGSQILIEGHLDQQSWEKDGKKMSKVVVIVDNFQFMSSVKKKEELEEDIPDDIPDEISINDIPF